MKLITITFIILALYSCNSKYDKHIESDEMYNILSQDFNSDIEYFNSRNNQKLDLIYKDSVNDIKAAKFHQLITSYTDYIFELELELVSASESPFFSNDSISELGQEYLKKKNLYREQFLNLIVEKKLREHVLNMLRDESPKNRNGIRTNHMDYYFKGISRSGTIAYLKNKRRIAHEIEYEYLISLQLDE